MTNKHLVFLIVFMICLSPLILCPANPESRPKAVSYQLEVDFLPDAEMDYAGFIEVLSGKRPSWNKLDSLKKYPHMIGKAEIRVDFGSTPHQSFTFYLHGELQVHKIQLNNEAAEFSQAPEFYGYNYSKIANAVTIKPANPLKGEHWVVITYGGMFNPCYAGSPSNYMRIDHQGAYLRGYGYSLWFPMLLPSGSESEMVDFKKVTLRTPKTFSAVFGGRKLSEKIENGFNVSHWEAKSLDLRSTQIVVRPYKQVTDNGVNLYYLDHPRSGKASKDILSMVKRLLSFYGEHYKAIKHQDQLHVAELPNFASGISSGNMIGITSGQWRNFSLTDKDTGLEVLVAHELVHPFVKPEFKTKSPLAALFIEGFPSYFHLHALAEIFGEKWYNTYLKRTELRYLKKKKTGKTSWGSKLPEEKPILSITWDEVGNYKDRFILSDRVLLFLNYIREKCNKKKFKQFTGMICRSKYLTPEGFIKMISGLLPGMEKDLSIWLTSNDYPQRFHLKF